MQFLLQYTYLLDVPKIDESLEKLWYRYQEILQTPDWKDLNEARGILFFVGHIYCEQIAPQAIERRLHQLQRPLPLIQFFTLIDSHSSELQQYRQDPLFKTLEEFYQIIKKYKNKNVGGKQYLDEEKFIKLYNFHNPNKEIKIKEKGKFGNKK